MRQLWHLPEVCLMIRQRAPFRAPPGQKSPGRLAPLPKKPRAVRTRAPVKRK